VRLKKGLLLLLLLLPLPLLLLLARSLLAFVAENTCMANS
jgi:hypothetical protein